MTDGRVRRGYLGISGSVRPLPRAARAEHGGESCIEVLEVVPGSPAEGAGIRAGDLLVDLDGKRLDRVADLQRLLQHEVIGSHLIVTLLRDGLERRLQIVPAELG